MTTEPTIRGCRRRKAVHRPRTMDPMENNPPVILSFQLTRWQRALNPVERLLYVLVGMPLLATLPLAFMRAQGGLQVWFVTLFALGSLVFIALPTALYFRTIFSDHGYIDRIEIHGDLVRYQLPPGISGRPANLSGCQQPRATLTLTKGLAGTFVLRDALDGRKTVVLPRTCATYDQLKQLFPGPRG